MTAYSSVVKPTLFLGENSSIVKNAIVCSFRIENNLKLIKNLSNRKKLQYTMFNLTSHHFHVRWLDIVLIHPHIFKRIFDARTFLQTHSTMPWTLVAVLSKKRSQGCYSVFENLTVAAHDVKINNLSYCVTPKKHDVKRSTFKDFISSGKKTKKLGRKPLFMSTEHEIAVVVD